jgi:hypothetical protein
MTVPLAPLRRAPSVRISGSDSTVLITADSVDAVLSAVHLSDDT